jgi:hypothetical protein
VDPVHGRGEEDELSYRPGARYIEARSSPSSAKATRSPAQEDCQPTQRNC